MTYVVFSKDLSKFYKIDITKNRWTGWSNEKNFSLDNLTRSIPRYTTDKQYIHSIKSCGLIAIPFTNLKDIQQEYPELFI